MTTQLDLLSATPATVELAHGVSRADLADLRAHLISRGWQTRQEIGQALGWDDRKIRAAAETLGTDIVRCQHGYKLTESCTHDDVSAALQGCDAAESQAKKQLAYALGLRRRLHTLVG